MRVIKFGGTSVGSADAIRRAVDIVLANREAGPPVAVVVSAMSGVTDMLLRGAHSAASGDGATFARLADELLQRHQETLQALAPGAVDAESPLRMLRMQVKEFAALCHAIHVLREASPRALDTIAGLGERMNIHVVAAALEAAGCPAQAIDSTEVVVTDDAFQSASPDMAATRERAERIVRPVLDAGKVPVLAGFVGATPDGAVTTLGRGASDFSAAIYGVALKADEVWICTDVNGVMSADPRVVPQARTLPEVTFKEISELAFYGAKVLQPKTIRPVLEQRVALWVKNTFDPGGPCTRIVPDNGDAYGGVKAVTAIRGQCIVTVEGRGMLGVPGIAARTFGAVARTGTSVVMISQASSEQSICFVVEVRSASRVVNALRQEFHVELQRQDIDSVWQSEEAVIVTAVGAGMRHTPGIAGKVFSALGAAGINVIAIAQGSSECSISLAVAAADADAAVRTLHEKVIEMQGLGAGS